VIVGPRQFAVAAKRIRSPGKLIARVKEAIHQIERTGLHGWVALDVTLLASDPDQLPVNESSVDLQRIPKLYLTSIASSLREIAALSEKTSILGVQFWFFVAGLSVPEPGRAGLSTSFSIFPHWTVARGGPMWPVLKSIDQALINNSGPI
jgi:hypothetical protein